MNNNFKSLTTKNKILRVLMGFCFLFLAFETNAQISGTVFRDFNANGIKDNTATFNEIGLVGITIKAYNSSNVLVGSTTSATDGSYSLTGLTLPLRIEFSGLDTYDYVAPFGTGNTSSVQFYTAASTTANFGVNYPSDYAQSNPKIAVPLMRNGNTTNIASLSSLLSFNYNATGATPTVTTDAIQSETGTTSGLAWHRGSKKLFSSAFLRRHASIGTGGLGAIYVTDYNSGSTPTSLFVNLASLGVNFGTIATNATRGLGAPTGMSLDVDGFQKTLKAGIGDIDLSDDGNTLYVTNLFNRNIIAVNLTNYIASGAAITAGDLTTIAAPAVTCNNGLLRPFGLKYYKGLLYASFTCTGELAGGTPQDLDGYVYSWDGSSWTSRLTIDLYYKHFPAFDNFGTEYPIVWTDNTARSAWQEASQNPSFVQNDDAYVYHIDALQPIVADLEFDVNGDMVIGISDRTALQFGYLNARPWDVNFREIVFAQGDILRAAKTGSTFTLESGGVAGSLTSAHPQTNDAYPYAGPGGSEFYFGDNFGADHLESTLGNLLLLPGSGEVATTAYDPVAFHTAGLKFLSNTDGAQLDKVQLYPDQAPNLFGKGHGLGDIELLSDAAPIEIGNRVWLDTNEDGIQGAGETAISGVTVQLLNSGGTVIATATTDANGNYIFSSATGTSTTALRYGLSILPNTNYTIRVPNVQGGSKQAVLGTNLLANSNADNSDGDIRDSDGILTANNADIAVTTGEYGENNHTYDFGFMPECTKPNAGVNQTSCPTGTITLTGTAPSTGTWAAQAGNPSGASVSSTSGGVATVTFTAATIGTFNFVYTYLSCTDTVSVVVSGSIPSTPSCNPVALCVGTDATAAVTAVVSPAGGTITWNTGNATTATSYTYTVNNSCGSANCTNTITRTSVPSTPTCSVVNECTGADATAAVTAAVSPAGGTITWNTGNATTATSYTYTVSNSCGSANCTNTITRTSVPSTPTCSVVNECTGADATAAVTAAVSPAGGTITWNTGNATTATSYTYTVNNSCGSANCTNTITRTSSPSTPSCNPITLCVGADATAMVTAAVSPAGGTITWTGGSGTATTATGYTYTVTSSCGSANCSNAITRVQATIGNYVWSDLNNNGLQDDGSASGINGVTVELWNATTNTLISSTVTATNLGNPGYYNFNVCTNGDYKVKFPTTNGVQPLTIQTATAATDNNSDADISTGFSPVFTMTLAGTGTQVQNLTIDAGYVGCTKPNAGANQNSCPGTNVNLTGSPTTGTWSAQAGNPSGATLGATTTGSATATFTNAAIGTYNFIYTTGSSCTDTMSIIIRATSTSTTNTTLCDISLPYTWNGLTFSAAGIQTAHLTNAAGCDSAATLNLTVVNCAITLTNVCPSMTVNLTTHVDSTGKPIGTIVSYHTSAVATDSNRISNPTAVGAGTYYVSYWDDVVGCYSPTSASITVNIVGCCPVNAPAITATSITVCSPSKANLTTLTITNTPQAGERLVFSTHNPPLNANDTLTTAQASAISAAGTYYAFYKNAYCFGPADSVQLIVNPKPNAGVDKFIECGNNQLTDTLKATPAGGIWAAMAGNPTGVTLGTTNTGNATIGLPTAPTQGTWNFIYTLPTGCNDTISVTIGVSTRPSIVVNMGTNPICKNGTVQLCPTPWGWSNYQWYKNGVAVSAPTGTASCITLDSTNIGSYTLAASNGAGCWSAQSIAMVVTYDNTITCSVTTGGGGGVESKTLGDIIAQRLYGNARESKLEADGLRDKKEFIKSSITTDGVSDINLQMLAPATVAGTTQSYISTPTDLVNFTNAVEVLAIDYTKNNSVKAVVFGTKTLGDVYTHTKPICDRLKGAVLQEVKTITVNGYNLIAYKIQQCSGEVEYAMNLSAGTATNRSTISLQSNWFTDNYVQDEKLYNFQLWAVSYDMVTSMATDIINKLQANGQLQAVTATDLPKAYVTSGSRKAATVTLNIVNNTTATQAVIELKEKATETAQETTRQIPVTIQTLGNSTIQIDVKDSYEATINLIINNTKTDMLYLNDGTWALDYNKNNTTVQQYNVTGESNVANITGEYRLLRNVNFRAVSKDYVSVYKTIGTKCNALNISNYNSIKFNANTTGVASVTITLISSDISQWSEQYSYTLNLDGSSEYTINLNNFKSSKYTQNVNSQSLTGVNFSFNTSRNLPTAINVSLSNARFSNATAIDVKNNLLVLGIYPNPNNGKFNIAFNSESEIVVPMILKLVEVSTGKIIKTQFVNATKGINKQAVQINGNFANGSYILTLEGDNIKYNPARIIVGK